MASTIADITASGKVPVMIFPGLGRFAS